MSDQIKIQDLRLGNIIEINGEQTVVTSISYINDAESPFFDERDSVEITKPIPNVYVNDSLIQECDPIPLTNPFLERCGFEYVNSNEMEIRFNAYGFEEVRFRAKSIRGKWRVDYVINGIGAIMNTMKYVHELQNVHYSITGKELKISR